ncbi:MAG: response regulator transcription factor [Terriglobia bacterium]
MKPRILVVEDERDLLEMLRYNLEKEGFQYSASREGDSGLAKARKLRPDLILLDVLIPGINGKEVCKQLKSDVTTQSIPIIFLTASSEEIDKMIGFELGADDYVTKPFSPRELIARIKAVLKRSQSHSPDASIVSVGKLHINFLKREVSFAAIPLPLSALEFDLFALLVSNPGRVYTREEILQRVWKNDTFVSPRTVDVHIRRLRAKSESIPDFPACIKTFRGVGYKFEWPS